VGLLLSHFRVSSRSFSMARRTESAAAWESGVGPGAAAARVSRAMRVVISVTS